MKTSDHNAPKQSHSLYHPKPLVLKTDVFVDKQRVPIEKHYNHTPKLPRPIAFYLRTTVVSELEARGLALGSNHLKSGGTTIHNETAATPEMDQYHVYATFGDAWFEGYTYGANSTSEALATQKRYHLTVKQEIGQIATKAEVLVSENHMHRYGDLRKHASDQALSCSEVRESLAEGNTVSISATILNGANAGRQVVAKLQPQHLDG